ncbi:hypothetical protein PN498_22275 [Oscillatoria sp. CS-180]|nr:hypothetical protein [Oscillatoria sp. CS-180]
MTVSLLIPYIRASRAIARTNTGNFVVYAKEAQKTLYLAVFLGV